MNIFHEHLIQHSLKSGGAKDHFRQIKVPGTALTERPEIINKSYMWPLLFSVGVSIKLRPVPVLLYRSWKLLCEKHSIKINFYKYLLICKNKCFYRQIDCFYTSLSQFPRHGRLKILFIVHVIRWILTCIIHYEEEVCINWQKLHRYIY